MNQATLKCEVDDSIDTFAIGPRMFTQLDLPSISYLQSYRIQINGLAWHGKLGEPSSGLQRGNVLLVSTSFADHFDFSQRSRATISISQADKVDILKYKMIEESKAAKSILEGFEVQPGDICRLEGDTIKITEGSGYITTETRLKNVELSKGLSKSKVLRIGHPSSQQKAAGFNRLAGKDEVIREVGNKILLPFNSPEMTTSYLGSPLNGVLIYGPEGVGISTVIKAVAEEATATISHISARAATDLEIIRQIYKKASSRKEKSIISVDPIDDIISDNGREGSGVQVLQECLDNSRESEHVITLATASTPDHLPQSLMRAGRLEQLIKIDFPNRQQRIELFKYFLRKVTPKAAIDYQVLADKTESYTGANIQKLVREAALRVMIKAKAGEERKLTTENILEVINARGFP